MKNRIKLKDTNIDWKKYEEVVLKIQRKIIVAWKDLDKEKVYVIQM
jgi:hypothetical protein